MTIKVKSLPANDGDCFIITYGEGEKKYNVLVDGGSVTRDSIRKLKYELEVIKELNQCIDLLIVTHIDKDHIEGILKIFELDIYKNMIEKVWFNSGRNIARFFNSHKGIVRDTSIILGNETMIGIEHGNSLENELEKMGLITEGVITQGQQYKLGDAIFYILAPSIESLGSLNDIWEVEYEEADDTLISKSVKVNDHHELINVLSNLPFNEDKSRVNASSIAFLFIYKNKKILMLGDTPPSIIVEGLKNLSIEYDNQLSVDLMKVSHHGSRRNTSTELLNLISCNKYLISTNGGKVKRLLPDKECLSRIITNNKGKKLDLYFNYPVFENIFAQDELIEYKIKCHDISNEAFDYLVEV